MKIEVPNGDIVDKVCILLIKQGRLSDADKKRNVERELEIIMPCMISFISADDPMFQRLMSINTRLWDIEDAIRDKERRKEFDEEFIQIARSVYIVNDERAITKKQINIQTNSPLLEEKSYASY